MNESVWWLALNASVVWFILSYAGISLFKSKALFVCLLILPVLLLPNLMPESQVWLKWYGASLAYGLAGLLLGVMLAEYQKTKKFMSNLHKPSFFTMIGARFCIGLSGLYILVYLVRSVFDELILATPILKTILDWSIPRVNTYGSLFEWVSFKGVMVALAVIGLCVLAMIVSIRVTRQKQKKIEVSS
jgi:hypothetical protein